MAQPIFCDAEGERHYADALVSRIETGDVSAWCDAHYIEVCRAILDAVDAAEIAATDAAALAALGDAGPAADPPTSPGSSDVADPPAVPPMNGASAPEPPEPPSGAARKVTTRQGPDLAAVEAPSEAGSAPR